MSHCHPHRRYGYGPWRIFEQRGTRRRPSASSSPDVNELGLLTRLALNYCHELDEGRVGNVNRFRNFRAAFDSGSSSASVPASIPPDVGVIMKPAFRIRPGVLALSGPHRTCFCSHELSILLSILHLRTNHHTQPGINSKRASHHSIRFGEIISHVQDCSVHVIFRPKQYCIRLTGPLPRVLSVFAMPLAVFTVRPLVWGACVYQSDDLCKVLWVRACRIEHVGFKWVIVLC